MFWKWFGRKEKKEEKENFFGKKTFIAWLDAELEDEELEKLAGTGYENTLIPGSLRDTDDLWAIYRNWEDDFWQELRLEANNHNTSIMDVLVSMPDAKLTDDLDDLIASIVWWNARREAAAIVGA